MYFMYYILGYLCGKCVGDKAVSALLNKCVSCGKPNVLLIISLGIKNSGYCGCLYNYLPFLVIADIIVITSILACSASIKPWLYPFLFYLQVTPFK